ncbi:MAG TPA: LLM class flavin-dependent oxidoreductase, partial [Actinomycetota bacterium]
MNIGVGLPNTVPGTEARLIGEWARRIEDGPFTSIGVLDRVRYDSLDPLACLAAITGTTSRVRLVTMVVVGPLRGTTILAKEAATIDVLSGGRLTLGLAVGAREDDYDAAGVEVRGRGRRFEEQLAALRGVWEDPSIGPRPAQDGGPELLVGGGSDLAFARVARYADGFVHGGGPP